jgi:hypothetical protein
MYNANKIDAFNGLINANKKAPINPSLGNTITVAGVIKKCTCTANTNNSRNKIFVTDLSRNKNTTANI